MASDLEPDMAFDVLNDAVRNDGWKDARARFHQNDIALITKAMMAYADERVATEIERLRKGDGEREPIPMLLFCPMCGIQHIDEPEHVLVWTGGSVPEPSHDECVWDNPPHRSHLCHGCGCIWRPADVATVGVARIETVGKADTWGESNSAAIALTTSNDTPAKQAMDREAMRDALAAAYTQGATDVHNFVVAGNKPPRGDPDFSESASDYASSVAILSTPAAPAVEDGFVVVPREPTEAMLAAGGDPMINQRWIAERYRLMIAAAPPAKGSGE